jgi:uncharacterized membrane protein
VLFTKELDSFDLVIWQNFRGAMYMMNGYKTYMANLENFVKERGGAFLMIGGHRGFFGHGMMDPHLEALLPVRPAGQVPNYVEGDFQARLSDIGAAHPIMNVGEAPAAAWARLPVLSGFNRTQGLVTGGLALLVHPLESYGAEPLPLVAIREVGAGRVMSVMTDYSWQWNFMAAGQGGSSKPYQRFWENSLRWLLQDPEMRLITMTAEKGRTPPAEPLGLTIEVLDETYRPTDRAGVRVEVVEQPEGAALVIPPLEKIGAGKLRLTVRPEVAGAYRLRAVASIDGRALGQDDEVFEAAGKNIEWTNVLPRPQVLEALAQATGGQAVSGDGSPHNFVFNKRVIEEVTGVRDLPLWDNWPALALTIGVLVLGWFLRRKWGLR